jgi:hypothetical protein
MVLTAGDNVPLFFSARSKDFARVEGFNCNRQQVLGGTVSIPLVESAASGLVETGVARSSFQTGPLWRTAGVLCLQSHSVRLPTGWHGQAALPMAPNPTYNPTDRGLEEESDAAAVSPTLETAEVYERCVLPFKVESPSRYDRSLGTSHSTAES